MTLTETQLSFTQNHSYPTYKSAISDEAGGTFPAATYSFIVVAWFHEDENYEGCAGLERDADALSNWEFIVGSGNRKITIDWNAATRTPHHYTVYYQTGADIDLDAPVTRCAEVNRNTTTVTILHPNTSRGNITFADATGFTLIDITDGTLITDEVAADDIVYNVTDGSEGTVVSITSESELINTVLTGGTDDEYEVGDAYVIKRFFTFDTNATTMIADLIEDFTPVIRKFTAIGYNALPVRKSQATNSIVSSVIIILNHTSITDVEWNTIIAWMGNSIDIKIIDGDTDAPIQTYYGRFLKTNYLNSKGKNSKYQFTLEFFVTSTSA